GPGRVRDHRHQHGEVPDQPRPGPGQEGAGEALPQPRLSTAGRWEPGGSASLCRGDENRSLRLTVEGGRTRRAIPAGTGMRQAPGALREQARPPGALRDQGRPSGAFREHPAQRPRERVALVLPSAVHRATIGWWRAPIDASRSGMPACPHPQRRGFACFAERRGLDVDSTHHERRAADGPRRPGPAALLRGRAHTAPGSGGGADRRPRLRDEQHRRVGARRRLRQRHRPRRSLHLAARTLHPDLPADPGSRHRRNRRRCRRRCRPGPDRAAGDGRLQPLQRPEGDESLADIDYIGHGRDGGYAEYVAVPAENAYEITADISDAVPATFCSAYLTAEQTPDHARLTGGGPNLDAGAFGGADSPTTPALTSAGREDALRAIGAEDVILRDTGDLVAEAVRVVDGPVDVVADLVAGPMFNDLLRILRPEGRYTTAGAIAGPVVELDL